MAKTKTKKHRATVELDSIFLLKLVLYLVVGSLWLWLRSPDGSGQIPIPIGLVIGFAFATHEHFRIDRKIEYALLLLAMFVGFWTMGGVYLTY